MITVRPRDGLFRVLDDDDSIFSTSPLTGAAWNPAYQHGGAVAGLLTPAMHKTNSPVPMRPSRLTFEIFRGVRVSELRIEIRVERAHVTIDDARRCTQNWPIGRPIEE